MNEKRPYLFDSFPFIPGELRIDDFNASLLDLKNAVKDYPTFRRMLNSNVSEEGLLAEEILTTNGTYNFTKLVAGKIVSLMIVRTGRVDKPNISKESVILTALITKAYYNRKIKEPVLEYRRQLANGQERVLKNNAPCSKRIAKFAQEMKAAFGLGF